MFLKVECFLNMVVSNGLTMILTDVKCSNNNNKNYGKMSSLKLKL